MRSRVLRRRAATAFGIYGAALAGFLATVVAARELSVSDFARFAVVFGTTSLLQLFVDLTIDEVVVKYGNRYAAREDWGRFRRLFEVGLAVKMAGGAAGSVAVVGAAFLAPHLWSIHGLRDAMLIAALIPLIQQPEGMAGALLLVRNRYDLRGVLLFWSMLLRLVAIAIGARHGLLWLFTAIVVAQVVSSITVCAVAYAGYRRYPRAERRPLGDDAPEIRRFAIQSTIASGLTSLRTSLPTLLIPFVSSGRQVSYFRVAQAPSTAFASLSAPARLVLLAEQTRDVEHGRTDRAYALLRRYIVGTALLGLVITPVLWFVMPTLVRWIYEAKYVPAVNAFRVMLLAAVVQLVFAWTKSFPVSIGRAGLRTLGQVCEIAVLVPAVLLLADLYGATGAAAGVLAGAVALAAFWSVALLRMRSPR
ncbi:MAG TPA: lipopolysaccharide biosynthesis protein [Gaiellaceae bacterium]|jgi:O-antigen/teichoic acid export membrane protein|nr:lipopolysaccharide biosynthesis protein [Gaiellaceae bacterium]